MEEVARSIRVGSTLPVEAPADGPYFYGGLVAGEGSFVVTTAQPPRVDGSVRLRFVFDLTMASRDRALLTGLRSLLGFGSVYDSRPHKEGWLPTSTLRVSSRKAHLAGTIPFMEEFLLPPTHKRQQFELWRDELFAYDAAHPRKSGRSICSEAGCAGLVRGRGLCRRHYYRATGH